MTTPALPSTPRTPSRFAFLLGILCCALSACGPADGPDAARGHRLLIVGWDGATYDLVDPLLERGRLPHLARLLAAGQSAWLQSTRVPISSAAWVGAVTGRGPGDTGVYDFFERAADSYDLHVVDARTNRCAPLWRILSNRGRRVNVFGVPITWPPEPVAGHLAAGMLAPPSEAWAWPPEYTDELRAEGLVPDVGMWAKKQQIDLKTIFQQVALKERALVRLVAQDDWDLSMAVFKSLDVLSHQLYDGQPQGPVAELLVRLDLALGALLEAAGPDTNVIVLSDHGFAPYRLEFNVSSWLVEQGYARLEGRPDPEPWGDRGYADYQEAVERSRMARVDLARTRAWASQTECEGNFGSIRLNVAGREPHGVVAPADADALLAELERALLDLRAADRQIVLRVWRGHDLYPGPHADVVPDLIFETVPDHQVVANDDQPTFVQRDVPRPNHAWKGIFVAAGPDIAPRAERGEVSVLDLAPTALLLLDEPVYTEMTGTARTELLRTPREVRRLSEAQDPTYRAPEEAWDAPELDERTVRERVEALRELGYAEAGDR